MSQPFQIIGGTILSTNRCTGSVVLRYTGDGERASIRLRKSMLDPHERKKHKRKMEAV